MQSRTFSSIQRQRGYTLIEILVAVAIFATVMIVALLLYDQSNRVFKQSNESAEMQQNTRVAFEKVVADLRMAGFDYKRAGTPAAGAPLKWQATTDYSSGTLVTPDPPNGHVYRAVKTGKSGAGPTWKTGTGDIVTDGTVEWQEAGAPIYEQPDEQIEFAHDKAITIRANFDYEDPTTTDHGREDEIEKNTGGHFPIVTTGNDEIVTYALVSRSGNAAANKDTISFFADVQTGSDGKPSREAYPGGKKEREITITGVDLTNKYPPYTLMRYTLNDKGEVVSTALADNIRSMEFKYWEDSAAKTPLRDFVGATLTDFSKLGGLGAYDPATPAAMVPERLIRGKVRAVTASIVGMSPQPDYNYKNPSDTVAGNYRQYTLQSTIVGRNLGLRGVPQSDTNPPGPPTITNSCKGYCGVAYLSWAPAPGSGDLTYTILYDTSPSGSFSGVLPAGTQTYYAVDLTQLDLTKTFYFRVAATNAAGTTVSGGAPLALSFKNTTKPNAPAVTGVTTQNDPTPLPNAIQIRFKPGTGNANGVNPTCSSSTPAGLPPNYPSETKGYRVYRSKDPNFDPDKGEGTKVLDENMAGLSGDGAGGFVFTDSNVANCETYYYKVATVEWCNLKADYNTTNDAATALSAWSAASPAASAKSEEQLKAPTNLKQHVTSVCDPVKNSCDPVKLLWDPVTRDVKENDVAVERYVVYRQMKLNGVNVGSKVPVGAEITDGATTITDTTSLLEHVPGNDAMKFTYEYTVHAKQCSVEGIAATLLYPGKCVTGATLVPNADGPGSGTRDDPMMHVESIGVQAYAGKPIKVAEVSVDGGAYVELDKPYEFEWDVQDGEVHSLSFKVQTDDCTEILPFYIQADAADCALRTTVSNILNNDSQLLVTFTNISDADVTIDRFDVRWLGQTTPGPVSWHSVRLPSGKLLNATATSPATLASPRTVTFTPDTTTDKLIESGETYSFLMTFTGGVIRPNSVGGVSVDYHEENVSTQFGCGTQFAACGVSATVTAPADGEQMFVNVTNSTQESLSIQDFTIEWAGQTKWEWTSITAESTIALDPPATGAATETFTPSGAVIPPGATYTITMNMTRAKGAADLVATTVGDVYLTYSTPTTQPGTLFCRAK
jgi:prepilin-type N-terminal cleavage/methylation domain-containing protein